MDVNGEIFIPEGKFDFYQAKRACSNHEAKMYAPESKIQRLATMKWYKKFLAPWYKKLYALYPQYYPHPDELNNSTFELYDEDLPWLGFHFDTKHVMFKKIDDDKFKMPTGTAPSK